MSTGMMFGPHTLQVNAVIDRIANLSKGQVSRLSTGDQKFLPMNTAMDYRMIKQEMFAVSAVAAAWAQWEIWKEKKMWDFSGLFDGAHDIAERRLTVARAITHHTIVAIIFQMDVTADTYQALTSIWAEVVAPIPTEAKQ